MCCRCGEALIYWILPVRESCGRAFRGNMTSPGLLRVRTAWARLPAAGGEEDLGVIFSRDS